MIARDELHTLLDAVPDEKLEAARAALATLADPLTLALLNAPEDDEPLTDEDRAAIAEGEEDRRLGLTVPLEEYVPHSALPRRCRGVLICPAGRHETSTDFRSMSVT